MLTLGGLRINRGVGLRLRRGLSASDQAASLHQQVDFFQGESPLVQVPDAERADRILASKNRDDDRPAHVSLERAGSYIAACIRLDVARVDGTFPLHRETRHAFTDRHEFDEIADSLRYSFTGFQV
jgi:hypothetical protein